MINVGKGVPWSDTYLNFRKLPKALKIENDCEA